jgi:ComF family protein
MKQALFSRLKQGSRRVLDFLYPPFCYHCQKPLEAAPAGDAGLLSRSLCTPCAEQLQRLQAPYCQMCGEAYSGAVSAFFTCSNCTGRRFAFEFACSAYQAEGPLLKLIHQFKYQSDWALGGVLTELLAECLAEPRLQAENLHEWLLVPVPLHWWRQLRRQYNQSWELCRQLSQRTGIPARQVLRRRRATVRQAGLYRRQRLVNLKQAFQLRRWPAVPDLSGKKILLVDDVLTTGSTAHECAQVLRRQGKAARIIVITLARG